MHGKLQQYNADAFASASTSAAVTRNATEASQMNSSYSASAFNSNTNPLAAMSSQRGVQEQHYQYGQGNAMTTVHEQRADLGHGATSRTQVSETVYGGNPMAHGQTMQTQYGQTHLSNPMAQSTIGQSIGQSIGQTHSQTTVTENVYGGSARNSIMQGHGHGLLQGQTSITSHGVLQGQSSLATIQGAVTQMRGEEREITVLQDYHTVIGERIVEHQVRIPKKIIREDVFEKVIIVPEKVIQEEIIEEIANYREKIIEVAKPVVQEKVVEVAEIEYVERIVEVPEIRMEERIKEVVQTQIQERIQEIPRIEYQERITEVPEYQYIDKIVERVVEVPEYREEVVRREVQTTQYVDKPVAEYVTVEVPEHIQRTVPVPVELVSTWKWELPRVRSRVRKVSVPIYVPHFVEVPVLAEYYSEAVSRQAEEIRLKVQSITSQSAASLADLENVAAEIKRADFRNQLQMPSLGEQLKIMWQSGRLNLISREQFGMQQQRSSFPMTIQQQGVPTMYRDAQRTPMLMNQPSMMTPTQQQWTGPIASQQQWGNQVERRVSNPLYERLRSNGQQQTTTNFAGAPFQQAPVHRFQSQQPQMMSPRHQAYGQKQLPYYSNNAVQRTATAPWRA